MIDTKYKIKSKKNDIFPFINGIIMVLFVIVTLYPVLNTLAISLNDGTDALRGGIYLWPRKFTWKNYTTVLHKDNLITGAYITVARTLIGTLLSLAANAILAFIVSRKRFLFQREVSLFWVITMYVNGGMIPTFLLYKGLGLTNNFWVYVIPGMVSAFNMLVIRTYMNGIPDSLEESAQLDGAGYSTIFLKIYSPLCKPVYATVALFVAVGQWNSWFDAMLYNRRNQSGNFSGGNEECRRNRNTDFRACSGNDHYHAAHYLYLSFLTEVLCSRTYFGWRQRIKIGERANGRSISDWNLSKCIERVRL